MIFLDVFGYGGTGFEFEWWWIPALFLGVPLAGTIIWAVLNWILRD